jgi:K+-sensing histidine kinase KdpD
MSLQTKDLPQPSYEALREENLSLRREMEDARAENHAVWQLLLEANRRLQQSSAAIKAAVSSLLSYDIFWDDTNQREFLETINSSVDQVGGLTNLLALTFRLRAGNVALRYEAQALPEILSVVQDHLSRWRNSPRLKVSLPEDGQPVWVNFEYLILALEYLIQAAAQNGASEVQLEGAAGADHWQLDFEALPPPCLETIQQLLDGRDVSLARKSGLAPEYQLSLFLAVRLLRQQGIQMTIWDPPDQPKQLRLAIPMPAR